MKKVDREQFASGVRQQKTKLSISDRKCTNIARAMLIYRGKDA